MASDETVTIEYTDADGIETRRAVRPTQLRASHGRDVVDCYDLGRRAPRTFVLDRINAVITRDGEVIDPRIFFSRWLRSPEERSSDDASRVDSDVPEEPRAQKPTIQARIGFWVLVALPAAYAWDVAVAQDDFGLGLFIFLFFAVPLFAARWLVRKIKSRFFV